MKIIKNEKLIKRNGKIGEYASLAGIIIIAIPAIYAVQQMFQGNVENANTNILFIPIIVGMILSQIGMHFGSRFGRSPRPDEALDAGLKGLPGDFTMYHYTTPVSHLLVGPAGIWVILINRQNGKATFEKNRWKMNGGGFMQGYMRLFGQETIGRPDAEADSDVKSLQKEFAKHMDSEAIPPISAALVFMGADVELDVEQSPMPAMKIKQLKDFMRQKSKERGGLNPEYLAKIKSILPQEE
jgi:hypothetical protein